MKSIAKFTTLVLLPIFMLSSAACLAKMKGEEEVTSVAMDNGVIIVDTMTVNATVVSKNMDKGKITLKSDAGGKSTFKVGKDIGDISGINVGDRVKAVVTEEVAVVVGADVPDAIAERAP